jgi:16S rRNA (uracil1498-N3)-methyltransferase
MHWESFYVHPDDVRGDEIRFREEETKHLGQVMRKKKYQHIWVVDGQGKAYEVQLMQIGKKEATGKIIHTRRRFGEPMTEVTLAQSILKGDHFDDLVEKTTEIGVWRIIPMITDNTIPSAGPQKLARWRRIAVAAMKQSGRSILPEITGPAYFQQILETKTHYQQCWIAHSGSSSVRPHFAENTTNERIKTVLLLVGPEGGFSDAEIESAKQQGIRQITLGPRRLRAETAGIVLTTRVLSELGDLE